MNYSWFSCVWQNDLLLKGNKVFNVTKSTAKKTQINYIFHKTLWMCVFEIKEFAEVKKDSSVFSVKVGDNKVLLKHVSLHHYFFQTLVTLNFYQCCVSICIENNKFIL